MLRISEECSDGDNPRTSSPLSTRWRVSQPSGERLDPGWSRDFPLERCTRVGEGTSLGGRGASCASGFRNRWWRPQRCYKPRGLPPPTSAAPALTPPLEALHLNDTPCMSGYRVAADIGGTFTDIALLTPDGHLSTGKLLSTPSNYADAVVEGVTALLHRRGLAAQDIAEVLHGCTVATNAILEHKGARTALITTQGFRDVLELRRVRVPRLYAPLWKKPPPLVPRRLRFEAVERIGADGRIVRSLDEASLEAVIAAIRAAQVEAVAVCLINAFANPVHEQRVGARLRAELPGTFISLSTEVLPQIREYERTSTTVVNAYVGPPVKFYLGAMIQRLASAGVRGRLLVMQSSGGMLAAEAALERPAQIVECGPAAGVIGARHLGSQLGYENIITFDMGGTTAKASLIERGRLSTSEQYEVGAAMSSTSPLMGGAGYALKLPVIDVSEVGAGGGSIVRIDSGGALAARRWRRVSPRRCIWGPSTTPCAAWRATSRDAWRPATSTSSTTPTSRTACTCRTSTSSSPSISRTGWQGGPARSPTTPTLAASSPAPMHSPLTRSTRRVCAFPT